MDDLHGAADKLFTDVHHLDLALEAGQLGLALAAAKRVRRTSTILVRLLAQNRDNATTQEGKSNE